MILFFANWMPPDNVRWVQTWWSWMPQAGLGVRDKEKTTSAQHFQPLPSMMLLPSREARSSSSRISMHSLICTFSESIWWLSSNVQCSCRGAKHVSNIAARPSASDKSATGGQPVTLQSSLSRTSLTEFVEICCKVCTNISFWDCTAILSTLRASNRWEAVVKEGDKESNAGLLSEVSKTFQW